MGATLTAKPQYFDNFVCEVCGPSLWRSKLDRTPFYAGKSLKVMHYEIPPTWVCQRKFRRGTNTSDFYIMRHEDAYLGTSNVR